MQYFAITQCFRDLVLFELPKLRTLAYKGVHTGSAYRQLQDIRDALDAAARNFSEGEWQETREDEYLCVVDALAMVNDWLIRRPVLTAKLKDAVKELEQLEQMGGFE